MLWWHRGAATGRARRPSRAASVGCGGSARDGAMRRRSLRMTVLVVLTALRARAGRRARGQDVRRGQGAPLHPQGPLGPVWPGPAGGGGRGPLPRRSFGRHCGRGGGAVRAALFRLPSPAPPGCEAALAAAAVRRLAWAAGT